jgi:hypothetical protein
MLFPKPKPPIRAQDKCFPSPDEFFLRDIKVGDKFLSFERYDENTALEVVRVKRLTPTQIVLENGVHLNRSTGRVIGGRSNRIHLPATEQRLESLAKPWLGLNF